MVTDDESWIWEERLLKDDLMTFNWEVAASAALIWCCYRDDTALSLQHGLRPHLVTKAHNVAISTSMPMRGKMISFLRRASRKRDVKFDSSLASAESTFCTFI